MSKFWVELPADEYGNRAFTNSRPRVIEAELNEAGTALLIIAPDETEFPWRRILIKQYGGWLEVDGPARSLTWDEREALIELAHSKEETIK
jgi:hypothetical protein